MALAIAPYTEEWQPAVRAFNQRLAEGGIGFQFPDPDACTSQDTMPIVHRGFVAVQDGESVRGGYLVQEQDFLIDAQRRRLAYLHLPLSEGLIDRRYSTLGVQLILHALKRQPLMFGLGIGGHDEAFARLVLALGWKMEPVPFLVKVLRPSRVARGLTALRGTPLRRLAGDAAAMTGVAALGAWLLQHRGVVRNPTSRGEWVSSDVFDAAADPLWEHHRQHYRLIASRDAASLRQLYPAHQQRFLRWIHTSANGPVGWAVALDTQMSDHRHFGDLRVGTIVDAFGDPAAAPDLIAGLSQALAARNVDLIVSNQSSRLWVDSFRRAGFSSGPSNFLFAASPALARELGPIRDGMPRFHLTRGDGDGPIHL